MGERHEHAAGTFCWVDLATTDAQAAKDYYAALFGWTGEDSPTPMGTPYTMLSKDGRLVAGLWQLPPESTGQGVPTHWQSFVSVEDVDATVARATGLGARPMMEPQDVMDAGRMALVQDPGGAAFGLWQPRAHHGAALVNAPGSLCWNELHTNDTEQARGFYQGLFGWRSHTDSGATGQPYTSFLHGDREAAGMLQIQPDWGPIPPNWAVYFAVEDCDATLERARSLGGQVAVPPMDAPGIGRFAFVSDPQGGMFAVIALEAPDD